MFIKLQQKITKKMLQFTIASSQQLLTIINSTLHIFANVYIEITLFRKNKKFLSKKRKRSFKKKLIVTITLKLQITSTIFLITLNERTIANQIISTTFLILLNELQTIDQITLIIKNIDTLNKINNDLKFNSIYVISNINFQLIDNLIYYCKNKNNRLCIFINYVQNIL